MLCKELRGKTLSHINRYNLSHSKSVNWLMFLSIFNQNNNHYTFFFINIQTPIITEITRNFHTRSHTITAAERVTQRAPRFGGNNLRSAKSEQELRRTSLSGGAMICAASAVYQNIFLCPQSPCYVAMLYVYIWFWLRKNVEVMLFVYILCVFAIRTDGKKIAKRSHWLSQRTERFM